MFVITFCCLHSCLMPFALNVHLQSLCSFLLKEFEDTGTLFVRQFSENKRQIMTECKLKIYILVQGLDRTYW